MKTYFRYCLLFALLISWYCQASAQASPVHDPLKQNFLYPPASAKPWVFWYWMHAAVSKEGITADLEAMKSVGIGGAYLMPIKDTSATIDFTPTARQLSPEWWALVKFAMQEAKRLDLQLAMHVSDGFALAGGPWIKPAMSMQKLVWSKTFVRTSDSTAIQLEQPQTNEGYYEDIAVFAYPANFSSAFRDVVLIPNVTTSTGAKAQFLSFPDPGNKQSFRSDTSCWIQYKYPDPITCRSIRIHVGGNNYQSQRFLVQTSENGNDFKTVMQLSPPRHGWQDTQEDYTYAIPTTTAKYFRFLWNKTGSEPGSEDLDAAKWKPSLKVMGIFLSDEPVINQYETKNGSIWRVAENTTSKQVSVADAVKLSEIVNLSSRMDRDGNLGWPAADRPRQENSPGWVIIRIGHTSTGQTNATGGAGRGLECDKFSAAAVKYQFDNWFARAFSQTDSSLAREVLKIFHVDSWECGSQNWSKNFSSEFKARRGYDLTPYLITMTGVPVSDAATSEKVLHDVRQTIADLVNDVFYQTLKTLAHKQGVKFSAEAIAPTMVSDGLIHYKNVDLPMGEFWLNSPTHDKPNDMMDAISGAHIYGKNIVQAEAFTSVRMNWAEHPGNIKSVGDRNYALGINRMVMHVFTHNPWMNKMPGMTLDGVGLYYQRDQTWFQHSKALVDYMTRCQAVLQAGKPVVDIAVFTGEEIPRRSILPDRLISTLPGLFGDQKEAEEKQRLLNSGEPLRQIPDGVSHSANMADPEDWIDPLNGYKYDSFNPDVLLTMTVRNGRVQLPGGASYAVLVFPGKHPLQPNHTIMSFAVAKKILQLVKDGARVIIHDDVASGVGFNDKDANVRSVIKQLLDAAQTKSQVVISPYTDKTLAGLGVEPDLKIFNNDHSIAWTHRSTGAEDIYFIANQKNMSQQVSIDFRVQGRQPEIWDAVTGKQFVALNWKPARKFTNVTLNLDANQSLFLIFKKLTTAPLSAVADLVIKESIRLSNPWLLKFEKKYGADTTIVLKELKSWTVLTSPTLKYYSGTVTYTNHFQTKAGSKDHPVFIQFDSLYNTASVKVNGIHCGIIWTPPYRCDISKAVKAGENTVEVEVANTWHNRLIGDNGLAPEKKVTYTTAPFRLKDKPLLPAGLVGEGKILVY